MVADYIRRGDAVKIAEKYGLANGSALGRHTGLADCIASEISALTAADVAEVVRCKDCKYVRDLGFDFGGKHYGSYFCVLNEPVTTSGDGFCYKGTPNERAAV